MQNMLYRVIYKKNNWGYSGSAILIRSSANECVMQNTLQYFYSLTTVTPGLQKLKSHTSGMIHKHNVWYHGHLGKLLQTEICLLIA